MCARETRDEDKDKDKDKILKTIRCINKSIKDYNDKNTFH